MPNSHVNPIDSDDQAMDYPPFLADPNFGVMYKKWDFVDDESNKIIKPRAQFSKACIPEEYLLNLWDNSTEINTKGEICTLAISLKESPETLRDVVWASAVGTAIWSEDYSEESPLYIVLNPEKLDYGKDDLYKEVFRIYQECLEQNWDGYGATPMNESTFFELTKFIDLMPNDIPAPEVIPEPSGEIALEWYKDQKHVFVISFGGEDVISYAGIFGVKNKTHGTESFIDKIPNIIIDYIKRIK